MSFFYVPISTATQPLDGECLANKWWVAHKEKGLAFWAIRADSPPAPQCNDSEELARRVLDFYNLDEHEVVFMAVVYAAHARNTLRSKTYV